MLAPQQAEIVRVLHSVANEPVRIANQLLNDTAFNEFLRWVSEHP